MSNAQTGQSHTFSSGSDDGQHYASADGENWRNDGSGWQKQTASGWQSVGSGEDTAWADREQQARSTGQDRLDSFSQGGFGGGDLASRFGGGDGGLGAGDFGSRFGGGGFGGFRGRR